MSLDERGGFVENAASLGVKGVGIEGEMHAAQNDHVLFSAEHVRNELLNGGVAAGQFLAANNYRLRIQGGDILDYGFTLGVVGKRNDVNRQTPSRTSSAP